MGKIIKHPGPKKKSPKINISSKLRLNYPRLERNLDEMEEIPPEEERFYGPLTLPDVVMRIRLSQTLADEGYIKWGETEVKTFVGTCLPHVIYRSLKFVYGLPDPITLEVQEGTLEHKNKQAMALPTEWGYLIQGRAGSCFDIFSRYRDPSARILIWLNADNRPNDLPDEVKNSLSGFMKTFRNLVKIIDREYKIEEEIELIRKIAKGKNVRAYVNLYYQNFQAGKDILELSDTLQPDLHIQHNELFSKGEFDEALEVYRKMSILYVSAIVYFIMALEGFVNLIYKLLLKPQFTHKKFDRAVWKADLDLRILHMPVYCRGFTNAEITPDSEVSKQWLSIRDFRNNLVHSNITKECEVILTIEDSFSFLYNPLLRIKLKDKDKIKFHTQFTSISKDDANNVMKKVELIVSEIIEKMDEEIKVWVKRWISEFFTDFSEI